MDKTKVLIISNHHRKNSFFEDTISRLWKSGYTNVIIQDTGREAWGAYTGPNTEYWNSGHLTYDQGMVRFKNRLQGDFELILMIDNDCFISDPSTVDVFIKDFLEGGYDFSCHHIQESHYSPSYVFTGSIAPVLNQTFEPSNVYPWIVPNPHWENAFLLIKKEMWDSLTADEISHGRKWIKGLADNNAKFGAHRANYRQGWSHFQEGWFHVGYLMSFYYKLEKKESFDTDSALELSRLGFFLKHVELYPGQFPSHIETYLHSIDEDLKNKALTAWNDLTKDTCLSNWAA